MTDELNQDIQKPDAFEAALAASATEIASPVAAEVIEDVVAEAATSTEPELALASDEDGDIESDENDPNAEFRRTLRSTRFVTHPQASTVSRLTFPASLRSFLERSLPLEQFPTAPSRVARRFTCNTKMALCMLAS